jgi:hypothetical protein
MRVTNQSGVSGILRARIEKCLEPPSRAIEKQGTDCRASESHVSMQKEEVRMQK